MKQGSIPFTIAGIAALMSAPALAAAAPVGSKVHFATCTKPGVTPPCVVAVSGGATYNVTGLMPKLRPYQWLRERRRSPTRFQIACKGAWSATLCPISRSG